MQENKPAFICKSTTTKSEDYVKKLMDMENKEVLDMALYTPINSISRFFS